MLLLFIRKNWTIDFHRIPSGIAKATNNKKYLKKFTESLATTKSLHKIEIKKKPSLQLL